MVLGGGGVRRFNSYSFLNSELVGGEWSVSLLGRPLPSGKDSGAHFSGGSLGPRAGLDADTRGKILFLLGIEPRSFSPLNELPGS
jgi:hypothetical protein